MAGYICSACYELGGLIRIKRPSEPAAKTDWLRTIIYPSANECERNHIGANHGMTAHAKPIRIILFYRSSGDYGFMSNLFKRDIKFENRVFRSSEDAYQFGKPTDGMVAEWLISAPKPHLCAMAAHGLLSFDIRPDWQGIKVDRMRDVLRAKFNQHEDLKQKLLETGNAILVEDSKTDRFWGIGKKMNGNNMLGVLLMQVRDELRAGIP